MQTLPRWLGNLLSALKHLLGSGAQASFPTSVVEFAGKIAHTLYVQNSTFGYQLKECQGAYFPGQFLHLLPTVCMLLSFNFQFSRQGVGQVQSEW